MEATSGDSESSLARRHNLFQGVRPAPFARCRCQERISPLPHGSSLRHKLYQHSQRQLPRQNVVALEVQSSLTESSTYDNGRNTSDIIGDHHQLSATKAGAIETTSRTEEGSTVYLVDVPQNIDEASITTKLSAAFGDVLRCKIGCMTRIGCMTFAHREAAANALVS
ncbi:hypothetical protein BC936DRAFT_140959 [Jimgerdemannia flammicorona]|uniref:RRM domain-containing protein n=1 Tax=Jimgerdemannia flammicorona TaxID=994334 RepID=A0A433A351_9FUNG|nr:hypothetical protein BC936DRAFT_140959 [Jimgerdemannia flammicorona]